MKDLTKRIVSTTVQMQTKRKLVEIERLADFHKKECITWARSENNRQWCIAWNQKQCKISKWAKWEARRRKVRSSLPWAEPVRNELLFRRNSRFANQNDHLFVVFTNKYWKSKWEKAENNLDAWRKILCSIRKEFGKYI